MDLGNLNAVIANMGKVDNNINVNGDNSVKTESKSSNGNFKSVMSSKEDSLSKTTEDNKTTVEGAPIIDGYKFTSSIPNAKGKRISGSYSFAIAR